MKIRVVAYCRVSTEKEDQQNSFESQKKYFKEYIKSNPNWEFVGIYADEGISGTSIEKREDFKRMIDDARYDRFDLVLTKEIARFARNTKDSLEYTRMLKKMGIGVYFTNDNINTFDSDGELRLTIMSALAQDESRKTSERVKWGQKRRMEQGVVFGRELLGYNLERGVLTINQEEAEIVKKIFYKYIVEHKGTHVIARELYEEGLPTKRANSRWSNVMILKILRNEKYVGDLSQKKTYTPDYLDHKKKYNRGEEEVVYIKDHHEPIIDRETWGATQEELIARSPSEKQKSKYSNRYWCSGKIVCGECGNRFVSRKKSLKGGKTYKAWRCIEAATFGVPKVDIHGNNVGCNVSSINHSVLGSVINFVLQSINSNIEQIVLELVQEIKKLNKPQKIRSTETLVNKINSLNSKKQKVIDSMIEGIISKDDMVLMNKKYDGEIDAIKSEVNSIEQINLINSKQADSMQIYVDRIEAIVNEMNIDDMEEVYKKMVKKITMYKDNKIEILLTCMPFPIKLQYSSTGKNGNYKVICELID